MGKSAISLRKILFVVNPLSGTLQEDIQPIIHNYFADKNDVEVSYLFPDWKNFREQISAHLQQYGYDTIVACGGDGTINAVGQCILGQDIKLGILPAGSANGLARNLNISTDIKQSLDIIYKAANCIPVSSITVNGMFSIHLADAGLNAKIVRHFEHGGKRGFTGYLLAGIKVLSNLEYFNVEIRTREGAVSSCKACMVVLANANMYGTGFVINAAGKLNDEKFEVIIIKKFSIGKMLRMALSSWKPSQDDMITMQVKEVEIHSPKPLNVQVDGEYIGKHTAIHASINKAFIDIITA